MKFFYPLTNHSFWTRLVFLKRGHYITIFQVGVGLPTIDSHLCSYQLKVLVERERGWKSDSSTNLNSLVTFPPCLLAQEASKVQISWIIQLFLQKALTGNRTSDLPGEVPSALTIQLLQQIANLPNKFNIWMSIVFDWLIVTKINFSCTSTFIYILGIYLDF